MAKKIIPKATYEDPMIVKNVLKRLKDRRTDLSKSERAEIIEGYLRDYMNAPEVTYETKSASLDMLLDEYVKLKTNSTKPHYELLDKLLWKFVILVSFIIFAARGSLPEYSVALPTLIITGLIAMFGGVMLTRSYLKHRNHSPSRAPNIDLSILNEK